MSTEVNDYLRQLKTDCRIQEVLIASAREELDRLMRERESLWKSAVFEHGVSRGMCAKFSELDVMVVSRALKEEK